MHTSAILACASALNVGVCGLLNSQKIEQNFKKTDREKDGAQEECDTANMPE